MSEEMDHLIFIINNRLKMMRESESDIKLQLG